MTKNRDLNVYIQDRDPWAELEQCRDSLTKARERETEKLSRIRSLEAELAKAREYPPDRQRPQLEPPPSENDEARRWADYAAYVEHLFVAQNFKLGDREKELAALREDIDSAIGDLNECASFLHIDQSGPESISGRLNGFLWAVKQLLAEATKDSERLDWLDGNCKELPGDAARVSPYTFPIWDYKLHNWRMYHDDEGLDVEGDTLRVVLDAARASEESDAD